LEKSEKEKKPKKSKKSEKEGDIKKKVPVSILRNKYLYIEYKQFKLYSSDYIKNKQLT
jgi:hypothetical protein